MKTKNLFKKLATLCLGLSMTFSAITNIDGRKQKAIAAGEDVNYTYSITSASWGTSVTPTSDLTWVSGTDFVTKNNNGGGVDQNKKAYAISSKAIQNFKSIKVSGKTNANSTGKISVAYCSTVDGTYTTIATKTYSASKTINNDEFALSSAANVFVKITVESTTSAASKWIYLKSFIVTCAAQVSEDNYKIKFNCGENGSGTKEDIIQDINTDFTIVNSEGFIAPSGKCFDKWSGSDGNFYSVGNKILAGTFAKNDELTLTAIWKVLPTKPTDLIETSGYKLNSKFIVSGQEISDNNGYKGGTGGVKSNSTQVTVNKGAKKLVLFACGWNADSDNICSIDEKYVEGSNEKAVYIDSGFKSSSPFTLSLASIYDEAYRIEFNLKAIENDNTIVSIFFSGRAGLWYAGYKLGTAYSVIYSAGEGSGTVPTQSDVIEGTTFTLASDENISYEHHTFAGWNDGAKTYAAGTSYTMPSSNITLTAVWNIKSYTVTFDPNNGTVNPTSRSVEYNTKVGELPTPERANCEFNGWKIDGQDGYIDKDYIVEGDVTFVADWTVNGAQKPLTSNPVFGSYLTTMYVGGTQDLSFTLEPTDTDEVISVTSSNSSIISVSNGSSSNTYILTANNAGSATITVSGSEGTYNSVTQTIIVSENILTVSITGDMEKKTYTQAESWELGTLTASGTFADSTSYEGEFDWSFDPASPSEMAVGEGTVKVTATAKDRTESNYKEIAVQIAYAPGKHQTTAFTVSEAKSAIDAIETKTIADCYVKGYISQIDKYNSTYKSITYWISEDGTTSNQFEVYSGLGGSKGDFSSINDIELGAAVIVKGTIKKFNSIYEFDYNNEIVSYVEDTPTGFTVTTNPSKMEYNVGDNFSPTGMKITVTYAHKADEIVSYSNDSGITYDKTGALQTSDTTVTIYYGGFSQTITITIDSSVHTESIQILNNGNDVANGISVALNEELSLTAVKNPSNSVDDVDWTSSDEDVAAFIDGEIMLGEEGTTTITATSGGASDSFVLTVTEPSDKTLSTITVTAKTGADLNYYLNENDVRVEDFIVTGSYESESCSSWEKDVEITEGLKWSLDRTNGKVKVQKGELSDSIDATILNISRPTKITMAYSSTTTANMKTGNNASSVGLSEADWYVEGIKGSSSNMPGLNKDGEIRIYKGNNGFSVKSLGNKKIESIVIDTSGLITVKNKNAEISKVDGKYAIDGFEFTVLNGTENTIAIKSIDIYYSDVDNAVKQFDNFNETNQQLTINNETVGFENAKVENNKVYVKASDDSLHTLFSTTASKGKTLTSITIGLNIFYSVWYKIGNGEWTELVKNSANFITRSDANKATGTNEVMLPKGTTEVQVRSEETENNYAELTNIELNSEFYMEKSADFYMSYTWSQEGSETPVISNMKAGINFTFSFDAGRFDSYLNNDEYVIKFLYGTSTDALTLDELKTSGTSVKNEKITSTSTSTSFGIAFDKPANHMNDKYSVALVVMDKSGNIVDASGVITKTLSEVYTVYKDSLTGTREDYETQAQNIIVPPTQG